MEHGGKIELDPEMCARDMAKLPPEHRDAAAKIMVPPDMDIPDPRIVPEFLPEKRKLDGARLIANFMQGLSARAHDPGRWWWKATEAVKQNPMNEVSNAKRLIRDSISDLSKATRSPKKEAGLLRLPVSQGQLPVPHPKPDLAWILCLHRPEKGGSVYFPHAGIILRMNPGDAVLFPRAGGLGISPIVEGYMYLMLSCEPPTPRLVMPWGEGKIVAPSVARPG